MSEPWAATAVLQDLFEDHQTGELLGKPYLISRITGVSRGLLPNANSRGVTPP